MRPFRRDAPQRCAGGRRHGPQAVVVHEQDATSATSGAVVSAAIAQRLTGGDVCAGRSMPPLRAASTCGWVVVADKGGPRSSGAGVASGEPGCGGDAALRTATSSLPLAVITVPAAAARPGKDNSLRGSAHPSAARRRCRLPGPSRGRRRPARPRSARTRASRTRSGPARSRFPARNVHRSTWVVASRAVTVSALVISAAPSSVSAGVKPDGKRPRTAPLAASWMYPRLSSTLSGGADGLYRRPSRTEA